MRGPGISCKGAFDVMIVAIAESAKRKQRNFCGQWKGIIPSNDVPSVLCSVTKFAACNTSTQAVVADTYCFLFEAIGKIIFTLGHSPNENAYALVRRQGIDIIPHSYYLSIEAKCDFSAFWW